MKTNVMQNPIEPHFRVFYLKKEQKPNIWPKRKVLIITMFPSTSEHS